MNKVVAIIGCGNIGKRHAQAVFLACENITLFLVDCNESSLSDCMSVLDADASRGQVVRLLTSQSDLPGSLDAVIVATTADVRYSIVQDILARHQVSYLILEKVLFQKVAEYEQCARLLKEKGVKTYVNCPRRVFETYQDLKKTMNLSRYQSAHVHGKNWGIGCNAIHYIDLFCYLLDTKISSVEENLEAGTVAARRPGFRELLGRLTVTYENNFKLLLESQADGSGGTKIELHSGSDSLLIEEEAGKASVRSGSGEARDMPFKIPYQSEITGILLNELFSTGSCNLPGYEESMDQHLPFLHSIEGHFQKEDAQMSGFCPVT